MTRAVCDVAAGYWHDAIYDPVGTLLDGVEGRNIKEGEPGEPVKFKAYRGLPRLALAPPALTLPTPAPAGAPSPVDGASLSTFLYYSYGLHRHDPEPGGWPYHRVVPSARCFFPTELYVAMPSGGQLGGVHYYDPMHHALVRLRAGDHRATVADATGADLGGAAAVVVLSSLFWKTAFRYRDYAYRLCSQEAGMVAANVLLVAEALGWQAHVHYLFRDRSLNRLLGLREPAENAFAVLALYPRQQATGRPLRPAPPGAGDAADALPELRTVHTQSSTYDPAAVPVLTRVSRAGFMAGTGSPVRGTGIPPAHPVGIDAAHVVPVPDGVEPADLAGVLRARDSGPGYLDFLPGEVPAEAVWRIARAVARPYPCDVAPSSGTAIADCYLAVHSVAGIAEGIYRVRPGSPALQVLYAGAVQPVLRDIAMTQAAISTVNFLKTPLTAFVVVPGGAAVDSLGARGFRILNQVAGIAAQWICVASARSGLIARVHNGYSARVAEQRLGLAGAGAKVLFQIAIGAGRPGSALRLPVAF
jgi:SagB-type dehydrogenase family enzyme